MMRNTLKIGGQTAVITYEPDIEMFRGEFINLNGGADFYADSVEQLKKEGAISLQVFLDVCKEKGNAPFKSFSGKVTTRLTPAHHEALVVASQATGHSINELLNEGTQLVLKKYEYAF